MTQKEKLGLALIILAALVVLAVFVLGERAQAINECEQINLATGYQTEVKYGECYIEIRELWVPVDDVVYYLPLLEGKWKNQ